MTPVKLKLDSREVTATLNMSRMRLESDITLNASRIVDASIANQEKVWVTSTDYVLRAAKHRLATKRALYWLEYVYPLDPTVAEIEAETARALLSAVLAHVELV